MQRFGWLLALAALWSCSANPPPRWAEGGAPLTIAPATWEREGDVIEIRANGQVLEDGDPVFLVDRAGRVVDDDYEPVAVLLDDGHVAGTDDRYLGRVGVANAAPPHRATAWLALLPDGQVVYFDDEGDRQRGGHWTGCDGPQKRTCTLVTHMMALQRYRYRRRGGVTFGLGVGVGF